MPAVSRGGPQSRASAPRSAASRPRRAAPKPSTALDPRKVALLAAGVAASALIVALATGGRAQALVSAIGRGASLEAAHAGFRLAHVRLEGVSPFARADVLNALNLSSGAPILGLDLADLREKVEGVGWVKSARVVRLLPDTLVVSASERPRLAVWQDRGVWRVVDTDGQVIPEADAAQFSDLPMVVGEGANEAAGAILPLVQARPRLMSRLDALVRVDARRWDLRLKDGGVVQLPATGEDGALIRLDQLDQKDRFLELGFAQIDLRDPEMTTVRPRGAPAAAKQG